LSNWCSVPGDTESATMMTRVPRSFAVRINSPSIPTSASSSVRDRQCNEHKLVGLGLPEESPCLVEAQIAPAFAQFRFHVLDQEIELVNIARDRAGDDGRRFGFGLKGQSATHSSVFPLCPVKPGLFS
jgi:hypothetical protein